MRPTLDEYYMELARNVATRSKDSTGVGAIIVGLDKEIRSTGYNGFPRGINDEPPERHERPMKYYLTPHAEMNAITNAARVGTPIKGCVMYVANRVPCATCMGMIVNAGIVCVVVDTLQPSKRKAADWEAQHEATVIMMEESDVVVRLVNEPREDAIERFKKERLNRVPF
jgi:dCMP deaminase